MITSVKYGMTWQTNNHQNISLSDRNLATQKAQKNHQTCFMRMVHCKLAHNQPPKMLGDIAHLYIHTCSTYSLEIMNLCISSHKAYYDVYNIGTVHIHSIHPLIICRLSRLLYHYINNSNHYVLTNYSI